MNNNKKNKKKQIMRKLFLISSLIVLLSACTQKTETQVTDLTIVSDSIAAVDSIAKDTTLSATDSTSK